MRIISSEIQKQISGLREFESIGLMRLIPNVRLPGLKKNAASERNPAGNYIFYFYLAIQYIIALETGFCYMERA